jgi:hypothetical protein
MTVSSVSISADMPFKSEGQSGSTSYTFTVTRSGDASTAETVDYAVVGAGTPPGGALPAGPSADGADFVGGTLSSGTVSFAAGETVQTITINVAGDAALEGNEAFAVTLSNVSSGLSIQTAYANATIVNDDPAVVSYVFENTTLDAPGVGVVGVLNGSVQVDRSDFPAVVTGTLTFTPSDTNLPTITGTPVANAMNGFYGLALGAPQFAGTVLSTDASGPGALLLNWPDATPTPSSVSGGYFPPGASLDIATGVGSDGFVRDVAIPVEAFAASVSIAADAPFQSEGQSGQRSYTFTVTRSGDTSLAQTVDYAVVGAGTPPGGALPAGGPSADGADFVGGTLPTGTVSFAAGETVQTITINVAGDAALEGNDAFAVTLLSPSSGLAINPASASATATILNDDPTVVSYVFDHVPLDNPSGGPAVGVLTGAIQVDRSGLPPAVTGTLTFTPTDPGSPTLSGTPVATAMNGLYGFTLGTVTGSATGVTAGASGAVMINWPDATPTPTRK